MASIRHNASGDDDPGPASTPVPGSAAPAAPAAPDLVLLDPVLDPVLDAAREVVLAVGVRRTTLTEVARRAGLSRMTIYRRWPDVRALVADLMTREG